MATMSACTRRFDNSQRDRFGDRDDQQRAFAVRDFADRRNILNRAEEVRRLNEHACRIVT